MAAPKPGGLKTGTAGAVHIPPEALGAPQPGRYEIPALLSYQITKIGTDVIGAGTVSMPLILTILAWLGSPSTSRASRSAA